MFVGAGSGVHSIRAMIVFVFLCWRKMRVTCSPNYDPCCVCVLVLHGWHPMKPLIMFVPVFLVPAGTPCGPSYEYFCPCFLDFAEIACSPSCDHWIGMFLSVWWLGWPAVSAVIVFVLLCFC